MATARLVEQSWLKRVLEVSLDDTERPYHVTYQGRGIGYEGVLVDGVIAARQTSYFWFVPRFPFRLSDQDAVIEVRVWPWLALRSLRLSVNGETLYSEG